jgi:hypothetical protein
MDSFPWILTAVVILLLIVFALGVLVYKNRKTGMMPDYRSFFILGVIWMPIGFVADNPAFWIIGLAFIAIGLINRDKWKEARSWSELSPSERRLKLVMIVVLGALVLLSLALYLLPMIMG